MTWEWAVIVFLAGLGIGGWLAIALKNTRDLEAEDRR